MLLGVNRDELEYTVLCDDAHDSFSAGLIVDVHQRYTPGTTLKHAFTGFIQWSRGMNRDCFKGLDANCLFDIYILWLAIVFLPGSPTGIYLEGCSVGISRHYRSHWETGSSTVLR